MHSKKLCFLGVIYNIEYKLVSTLLNYIYQSFSLQDLLLNYRNATFKMRYNKISSSDRKSIYEEFKEEKEWRQAGLGAIRKKSESIKRFANPMNSIPITRFGAENPKSDY